MGTWTRFFSPTVVIFGFTGLLMFLVGNVTQPEAVGDFLYLMGVAFFIGALLVIVGIRAEENFEKRAIRGEAIILSREQTGMFINNQPQVRFKLKVTLPGQESYEIELKQIVNLLDLGSISEGAKVQVRVDPRDKKWVEII
jgi:hypothetical protein